MARLVRTLHYLPNINPGSTRHVTFALLRHSHDNKVHLTRTLAQTVSRVNRYTSYHAFARRRIYGVYSGPHHRRGNRVYIIRDPTSVCTVRRAKRFSNHCFILVKRLSPLSNVNPSSVKLSHLRRHLTRRGVARIVLTAGPAIRNRTATGCVTRLYTRCSIRTDQVTRNMPINNRLRVISNAALSRSLTKHRGVHFWTGRDEVAYSHLGLFSLIPVSPASYFWPWGNVVRMSLRREAEGS